MTAATAQKPLLVGATFQSEFITVDPDILGGVPVFRGTRVPIETLFDYLQDSSIEDFLEGYPHISREMVNGVLAFAASNFKTYALHPAYESLA